LIDATKRSFVNIQTSADPSAEAEHARPQSMDEFLASVERRAFRLAQLALGHHDDALDVVQEAMIKLIGYKHKPAEQWAPLFWSILRRQLTDRHRRNTVKNKVMAFLGRSDDENEFDPIMQVADPSHTPEAQTIQDRAFDALGKALRTLPRRQRECFLLRELQGLSVADTAQAMGCSEGSVKTHLSRAIAALRTQLEAWQ
jgi:RNA polymerase sigma-70 factor, ECF subfamily